MKLAEIQQIVGEATPTYEIDPRKRYLMCVDRTVQPERCFELEQWLDHHGMRVTILPVDDVRLFEIED